MFKRIPDLLSHAILLGVLLLFGCGSKPVLTTKHAGVPAGVDLSGQWLVRPNATGKRPPEIGEDEGIRIPTAGSRRSQQGRGSGGKSGGAGPDGASVRVFLEFGDALKISQTYFGLFISYDRSVVEEYTYGENRMVAIGPIEAARVSGWEGQAFVVETLDDSGAILHEAWHLEENGAVLIRDIRISKAEKDSFGHRQIFDRQ